MRRRAGWLCLPIVLLAVPAAAQRWSVTDPGQGPVTLDSDDTGASELSGLTWTGGVRYYAVSDRVPAALYPLRIEIDPRTGTIRSAALEPGMALRGSEDLEGIAVEPAGGSVLVSDEVGAAIRRYRAADSSLLGSIAVPPVFASARKNEGLESLSLSPDGRVLWTANEEALRVDGPTATFTTGTLIRIQRLDLDRDGVSSTPVSRLPPPVSQWAYLTDPIPGDTMRRGRDIEASGVSEMVALPDGGLLVLERAYGAAGTRSRLYEVDFSSGTDTAPLPSLTGSRITPVRKRLLWERTFPDANFEGAALGPTLEDGGRSLVLVSDNGHALRQALYALVLRERIH
jgi:hypothetical protein